MAQEVIDGELLRQFVVEGSDSAFKQLVSRHLPLVLGTATRALGQPYAAEDISQTVFIRLAQKALLLQGRTSIAGWLHQTTVLEAKQWRRSEARRLNRETAAFKNHDIMRNNTAPDEMGGELDEALLALSDAERDALLMRFVEGRTYAEVGVVLGLSEDTVRKRIQKALTRLERALQSRGHTATAAAAVAALECSASLSLPALAARFSAAGLLAKPQMNVVTSLLGYLLRAAPGRVLTTALLVVTPPLLLQTRALLDAQEQRSAVTPPSAAHIIRDARLPVSPTTGAAAKLLDPAGSPTSAYPSQTYRWVEESDFARLPKSMAPRIYSYEPGRNVLNPNAQLSPGALEALGLTQEEKKSVLELFAAFQSQFLEIERPHVQVEKPTKAKDGPLLKVEPFGDECEPLRVALSDRLQEIIGPERSAVLWNLCGSGFSEYFHDFGKSERRLMLRLESSDDELVFVEDLNGGNLTRGHAAKDIHWAFKPLVTEWLATRKPAQ
ncbi:MAG TPA: RNA polymerase sigma factor [Methylomirabilota bacterium]|nr:RNA polymerase sigma factor [Methylomirabilota bacterium]